MTRKRVRITVASWTEQEIHGSEETTQERRAVVVADAEMPRLQLFEGAQLNLLLCETDEQGRLCPQHIVLEPDYLVDVTAICRCATECGDAPAHHLLLKFLPHTATAAIQLGAVANQFLDDITNSHETTPDTETLYRQSLRKSFVADPLRFSTVDGIDATFSAKCRQHFDHIRSTITAHPVGDAQLETAFLCEALGIQGRMDLMSGDARTIIELKSGKGAYTGDPSRVAFRYEHALQMALYKESLYYNLGLPYAQVQTLLFYSLYPALLDIRLGRNDIHRALLLRNGIVDLERRLRSEPEAVFGRLTADDFNPRHRQDAFYHNYLLPPIQRLLGTIGRAEPLARSYFMTFLAFMQREQALAKTGVEGVDIPLGKHGFADVWRTSPEARTEAGNLIDGLRLTAADLETDDEGAILRLNLRLNAGAEGSNFRPGDLVMLHNSGDVHFYFPCLIEEIGAERLLLRLRYPQRDANALNLARPFAIEPAHADSTFSVIYQGLFALLEAPQDCRALLLGERLPRIDTSRRLTLTIEDAALSDIVLRAKQAEDYFLLVGPPGTGKTSVALRQMVVEFLTERSLAAREDEPALLLTAFTNRAVDEICQMLSTIDPEPDYVRIGPELSAEEVFRPHTLPSIARRTPTRTAIRQRLNAVPVVVGTLASLSASPELFLLKRFRAAIVDEASQVLEPQMLPLFCAHAGGEPVISKFIFIGDHRQLPAVVVQSAETSAIKDTHLQDIGLTDCRRSLFERLHGLALSQGQTAILGTLHRQGRMHEDICRFASREYYDGGLDIVPLAHQQGTLEWEKCPVTTELHSLLSRHRLLCFDTSCPEETGAKHNSLEAQKAAEIVEAIVSLCQFNELSLNWERRLGIIVPFRSQIQQLRTALAERGIPEAESITIDTVERYQGSQRDIILFSSVVGARWQMPILSAPVEIEGTLVDRKLNVAITRARKQFILLGNLQLLSTSEPYRKLIDYIRDYASRPL